jgi:LuxR family maltose regulon positive regulatory protein
LYVREIHAHLAKLSLAAGDLPAVEKWYATYRPEYIPLIQQEDEALLVARLLMAQGKPQAALDLLNEWQQNAEASHRSLSALHWRILKALIYAKDGDLNRAVDALLPVIERAQAEGCRRLFLDEGQPMRDLLQKLLLKLHAHHSGYTRALLQQFSQPFRDPDFAEALSPQEARVLRLLAAGHSNPEIATELVVSVNTIKTQVKSIYRKLNVTSRAEARDVATHLNLM